MGTYETWHGNIQNMAWEHTGKPSHLKIKDVDSDVRRICKNITNYPSNVWPILLVKA